MIVLILKKWTFRKMVKAQLEEEGYNVLDFQSADDTSNFINNLTGRNRLVPRGIRLVVIDLMDGGYTIEKLKYIREKAGEVPILVLRGAVGLADSELKKENFNFILRRPFSIGRLVNEVKSALDKISR